MMSSGKRGSRFIIYGAGAIGSVFGARLALAGHEVHLVGRQAHMQAVKQHGIHITGLLGEDTVTKIHTHTDLKGLIPGQEADVILICVKSNDTLSAARALHESGLVGRSASVVSLQNGLGNVETLVEMFGSERVLGGRVIFGAEITKPGHVLVPVWADRVLLGGEDDDRSSQLAALFSAAGIDTAAVADIGGALWGKVLYNVGLNSLSAILEVPYGELGDQPEARELLIQLIVEAYQVASAEVSLPWPDSEDYLRLFFSELLPATVTHRSSMLQDLERGRHTEIEAINGEVVRRGRSHGIKVPANEMVYLLVKARSELGRRCPPV